MLTLSTFCRHSRRKQGNAMGTKKGLGWAQRGSTLLVFENKMRHNQKRNPSDSSGSLHPLFMGQLGHQK